MSYCENHLQDGPDPDACVRLTFRQYELMSRWWSPLQCRGVEDVYQIEGIRNVNRDVFVKGVC